MADDLDLYDDKVQDGISWAMRQWGEALGLTTWTQGDGSESVEGDVGAEIHTILVDAGLRCPETNAMATLATPMEAVAWREAVAEIVANGLAEFDGRARPSYSNRAIQTAAFAENIAARVVQALAVIPTQGLGSSSPKREDTHRVAETVVVGTSHPTGHPVADAMIAGFLHGVGREPWDDMHDYIAVCAMDYAKGFDLPARQDADQINWKAEWEGVCSRNITLANAARPFAEIADEFSACGDGQPIGVKAASGRSDLSVGDLRALATALSTMGPQS